MIIRLMIIKLRNVFAFWLNMLFEENSNDGSDHVILYVVLMCFVSASGGAPAAAAAGAAFVAAKPRRYQMRGNPMLSRAFYSRTPPTRIRPSYSNYGYAHYM